MSLELKGNLNARYINLGGNNLQMVFKAMVLDESQMRKEEFLGLSPNI